MIITFLITTAKKEEKTDIRVLDFDQIWKYQMFWSTCVLWISEETDDQINKQTTKWRKQKTKWRMNKAMIKQQKTSFSKKWSNAEVNEQRKEWTNKGASKQTKWLIGLFASAKDQKKIC